jgi:hypothetical protein
MRTVIIILLAIFAFVILIFIARMNTSSKYNYTIHYNAAKYSAEDYTNEFEYLPGNSSIRYVNELGDSIYRTGTFSIERNNHFQK